MFDACPARGTRHLDLRRIVAAGMKWVATADAIDAFERSSQRTVFRHCSNEVVTACRMKAALATDNGAQRELIKPHSGNQET